jgi:hypothetical protein
MDGLDKDHIWLRQTVTFTVDGQTRTLEIGVPVPTHATTNEIDALLEVADVGISALTRRLEQSVAVARGEIPAIAASSLDQHAEATSLPAPVPTAPESNDASNGRAQATPPTPPMPAAQTRADETRSLETDRPAPQPAASDERLSHDASANVSAVPSKSTPPSLSRPAAPSNRPAVSPSNVSTAGSELTRPQFIAAVADLGLNPRQAMDRLNVRSLEGLNLREALESLRRQLLGTSALAEMENESEDTSARESDLSPVSAAGGSIATSAPSARYFDEEDEETILYTMDEDDELVEDEPGTVMGETRSSVDSERLPDDLDEVPDLTPPPTRQRAAPTPRKPASTVRETSEDTAAPAEETAARGGTRTRALQLIGSLRGAAGGGAASDYQRNAYRNIVENELGRAQAMALVRGLWRTTVDQLSASQLDALIRWGKQEVFGDEAPQVIAALKAEQRRAEQADASDGAPAGSAGTNRPTARGRTAGGQR